MVIGIKKEDFNQIVQELINVLNLNESSENVTGDLKTQQIVFDSDTCVHLSLECDNKTGDFDYTSELYYKGEPALMSWSTSIRSDKELAKVEIAHKIFQNLRTLRIIASICNKN